MANPRKPRALKLLEGTNRKDRDRPEPEFPPATNTDTPDWLIDIDARKEWDRLSALLRSTRVLTEGDLTTLGHLCNLHAACVAQYRANIHPHAATLTQLRLFLAEFGLSPASRSKASQVGSDAKKNPFTSIKAG